MKRIDRLKALLKDAESMRMAEIRKGKYKNPPLEAKIAVLKASIEEADAYEPHSLSELLDLKQRGNGSFIISMKCLEMRVCITPPSMFPNESNPVVTLVCR